MIQFAAVTGWRIASEVLPLQWRQVDFDEKLTPAQTVAGTVRLDAGTTKSGAPRVFPMTSDLRTLLKAQWAAHEALRERGHLCLYVFFREVAEGRRGPKKPQRILTFTVAWKNACRLA